MISEIRKQYNAAFDQEHYESFVNDINTSLIYPADFKVCETPLFLTQALTAELLKAADEIVDALQTDDYKARTQQAIPPGYYIPNEDSHTTFLQIDFALCYGENGEYVPRLIELQGFPSLYCFQAFLDQKLRTHFKLPDGLTQYFNGLDYDSYTALLRHIIVGDGDPAQTILLEIEPEIQKTRIDFACTEQMLDVKAVDLSKVIKRGRKLYYHDGAREIPIERIYNRVIRDDPKFHELQGELWLNDEVDVQWIGHPNWYYKISKYSLPLLKSQYVPACYFVDQLTDYPADLQNYVLKPLFLYSGAGVELDVTPQRLDSLLDKSQYILQRKVEYAPLVQTPDGYSKAEIRLLFIWQPRQDRPQAISNLVRMSKGKMMGVRFNSGKTWVGSTLAYHPT